MKNNSNPMGPINCHGLDNVNTAFILVITNHNCLNRSIIFGYVNQQSTL